MVSELNRNCTLFIATYVPLSANPHCFPMFKRSSFSSFLILWLVATGQWCWIDGKPASYHACYGTFLIVSGDIGCLPFSPSGTQTGSRSDSSQQSLFIAFCCVPVGPGKCDSSNFWILSSSLFRLWIVSSSFSLQGEISLFCCAFLPPGWPWLVYIMPTVKPRTVSTEHPLDILSDVLVVVDPFHWPLS